MSAALTPPLQRGDFVFVTGGGRTVRAMVVLASPNGASIVLMFDGMIGGYVGMLPALLDDGEYCALVDRLPLTITRQRDHGDA